MNKAFKKIASVILAMVLTASMFPAETLAAFEAYGSSLDGKEYLTEDAPIEEIYESESDLPVEDEPFVEEDPQMEDGSSPEQSPEMPEADDVLVDPDISPESQEVNETEDDLDVVQLMATSYTSGDYTYTLSSGNAIITKYNGDATRISVPDTVDGYTVTGVGNAAFRNKTSIVSIALPNSITSIASNAFYGCTSLTSLNIPTAVTSIGSGAFYNCASLTEVTIPSGITGIGSNAFYNSIQKIIFADGLETIPSSACYGANNLTEVRIPSSVTKINNDAFRSCTKLASISLPNGITSLGSNAFYGCTSLSSLNMPATLTSIGSSAFYSCASLTEVTIPSGITGIGSNAFYNSIQKIIFADGLETIPSSACYGANNLTEVIIPSSVTKINNEAFGSCTKLESISLPNGITSLGNNAFYGCTALSSLNIPTAVTSIGSGAFYNCALLTEVTIPSGITGIGSNAFYNSIQKIIFADGLETIPSSACYGATNLTEVRIPSSVTKINNDAFRGCTKLASISLPNGITSLGNSVFYGCTSLSNINMPATLTSIGSSVFYNCSLLTELTIPASISSVSSNAFYNSIQKIIFSDGLVTIPSNMCYGATNLTDVSIPSSVTSIGNDAFRGCTKLGSISLPGGITSIGNNAFYGCTALKDFDIPAAVTSIGSSAFYNCSALTEITIPSGVTGIGNNAFYNSIQKISFKGGLKAIPSGVCYGATNLTDVSIPSSVTSIGNDAFRGCTKLASVSLPNEITSIGNYAFYGCTALKDFNIPTALTSIGSGAFYNCSSLTECTIPGSLTSIGDSVFKGCTQITKVILLEGVESIGNSMFYGCSALVSVAMPSTLRTIGNYAFYNCKSLSSVVMAHNTSEDAVISIGNNAFYNCTAMAAFDVPLSENATIGNNAFYNCVISGVCGENLTWTYDIAGQLLTITGSGDMKFEVTGVNGAPWSGFSANIRLVLFSEEMTSIADYSFAGCYNLKSVVIPDSVKTIGSNAFAGCTGLLRAEISSNLSSLGNAAFQDCDALDTVIFCGDVPSIGNNALPSGSDVTIYYPQSQTAWKSVVAADKTTRNYTSWDDTLPTRDIALVLDCSGSMSGNRIAGLKTAVNAFINQTGGRLTNTQISIVSFTSSATVRTGFTTDVVLATDVINSLTATGGTTYTTALNTADSLLESSSADIKSIIFFSDGEPGDSTSSIYSTAAAIRGKGYFVYTVGLCSAGTSYERILINVAGSETNYFPAADIDALVALFLTIDNNIGEENSTEVVLERNGNTYDLLTEAQSFENDSTESVNIVVTPYWGGAVPGSIRLTQNGKTISDSTTGKFENLAPAQVFSPGKPIYMVMLDSDGNIAVIKKLLIEVKADYLKIDDEISIPDNMYCIHVVNEDGYPLSGATVTWSNSGSVSTKQTDSDGNAFFDLLTIGEPVISVTLKNFITWTNENSNWKKSDKRYDTVVLYPESAGGYKLKYAQYSNSSSMSNSVDLLTKTKKLNLKNTGNGIGDLDLGNFYLTCAALDSGGVDHYELWQGEKKITESQDGNFGKLSVTGFSKGGGCLIRVVSSDGKKVDTDINLEFAENTVQKETGVSILKDKISITVADDVPFLGGSTFNVGGVGLLPVEIKATEDKAYIGFNSKIWDSSDTSDSQTKGKFDSFKKSLQTAAKANTTLGKRDKNLMNSLMKMEPDFDLPGGSVKFNVVGYAEANWGSSTATGEIYIVCRATTPTFGFTTWVVVVPVTVQISGYLEVKVGAKVSYNWENSTFNGEIPLNLTVGLDAFGGVGVGKAVGVGAYGSANVAFGMQVFFSPFLKNADLTGDLGVKAYIGPFEYKKSFAHNTWHLYTANSVRNASLTQAEEAWNEGIYDASQYEISDLSYLSEESEWMSQVSLMNDGPGTSFTSLLTNTYRNAQPTMISANNAIYAAFIRADQSTGARYVVMAKFDGVDWTEPVQVDSGAICDATPSICADGNGNIWLAYARTTKDTGKSLVDYAQNQEIVVGTIDPDTLAFTTSKTYPGNEYARLQTMELFQNSPALAWVDSTVTDDNSVLHPSSGTIRYATCSDGVWSEAITLADVNSPIDSLTIGEVNGTLAAAYISDDTLYQADESGTTLLATGVTGHVRYGTIPGTDIADFIWNGDGILMNSSGESVPVEGITHEYAIVGNKIYYSAANDDSANLMVIQYDNGNWSLPMQLTDEDRYLENLSVAQLDGQDYVLGMHTAATITEDNVEDAKNLVWSGVMPVNDLRLDDVSYDDDAIAAGDTVPVTLTVTNVGDHEVAGISVTLDGTTVKKENCSLLPGQSMEIETSLICPDVLTTYTYAVSEVGMNDDYTPDNNTAQLELGYADVETDLVYQHIGAQKTLLAYVNNIGVETAGGRVVFYDADGTAVAERAFDQLASGDIMIIGYDLPQDFKGINGGDVSVSVTLDQEELYTYNNDAGYHIMSEGDMPSARIENISINGTDVTAQIDCDEGTTMTAYCAYYDGLGRILCVKNAALETGKTNTQMFSYNGTNAEYVKLFVWDTNLAPMCAAEQRFLQ